MAVLKLISVAVDGLAGGLAVAERAMAAATELGKPPGVSDERPDLAAGRRVRDAFPSQRASAAMLDAYVSPVDEAE